jgi:CHAT domain-containing protein
MKTSYLANLPSTLIQPATGVLLLVFIVSAGIYKIIHSDKNNHIFTNNIQDYLYKSNNVNPTIKSADIFRYNQDYLKAAKAYEKLCENPTLLPTERAYILNQLAFSNLMMNQDSIGKVWIEKSDTFIKSQNIQEQDIIADNKFNKGILYNHLIKPYQAKPYFEKALASYRTLYGNNHLKVATCLTHMGLGLLEYERFTDTGTIAFYNIRLADDIFQANPSLLPYSAEKDLAMGSIALLQRDHALGQAYPDRALQTLEKLPYTDTILKGRIICLKGNLVKKNNQLDKAEDLFLKAITLAEHTNHPRLQEFYRDLVINYVHKKDEKAFWQTLSTLETLVKKQGFDYFAFPERLKGFFYRKKNDHRKTIDFYKPFWERHERDTTFNYFLVDETMYILIDVYSKMQKHDSALFYMHKDLFYKTPFYYKTPNIEDYFLSNNYRQYSNPSAFMTQAANTLFAKFADSKNEVLLKQALRAYILADSLLFPGIKSSDEDIISTFQSQIGDDFYPKALQAVWQLYEKNKTTPQYRANQDEHYLDYAFRFTERMKAYLLYRDNNQVPDSIKKYLADLNFLKWRQNQGWQDKDLANNIIKAKDKYEKAMQALKQASDGFLINNIKQPIPTVAEVQDSLAPDEAVIEYSLAGNKIHMLYISPTQKQFHQADTVQLDTLIRQYLAEVKNTKCAAPVFGKTAYKLYQKLLAPFGQALFKTKKLLIIPDRALHLVPFEALVTVPQFNSYQDTNFLLNKFETISYSPSWKMYQKNRKNSYFDKKNKQILCFTYGDTEGEGALKDSKREIESIEKAFGQSQVEINMYANCSKKRFLEKIMRKHTYDIIHLSLHAKSNPEDRQDNKIWFKIKPRQDTLYGFEIQNLTLDTRLVVLSGCETAFGDTKTGEGVYALSRSFLQAGASNVVATLWSVSNSTNAEVMSRFYSNLSQSNNPNASFAHNICSAKRQYIAQVEDKSLAHPYYWAGIIALN